MSKKDIIVSVSKTETRIAMLEDDRMTGLYVERPEESSLVGNIYKGRVLNLITGLKAAFVDIGLDKNGFLPLDEIPFEDFPELFENESGEPEERPRPEEIKLKEHQETIVQVTKDSYGVKGPRVTSYISLAGRYMVLLVNARNVGVSRKLRQRRDRDMLFKIGREIKPEGMGLIIRTAAAAARPDELRSEARWLTSEWQRSQQAARRSAPVLIYQEPSTLIKFIRDSFTQDVRSLIVDAENRYQEIIAYLSKVAPRMRSRVKLYRDAEPIFLKYGIEDQIKDIMERKVWLPSGGYIVLDPAEALLVIDVNTGKSSKERQAERLALQTNLEAVREIVHQLRLRDIGGMIVVDLIDMERRENIDRVLREFRNLIHTDKARYRIGSVSEFGLLEFTRERSRASLTQALSEPCPTCKGRGRILSRTSVIGYIERWFLANAKNLRNKMVELQTSPRVADFLSLNQTETMSKMARDNNLVLKLKGDYSIADDDFKVIIV